ncbi:hypothetical protein ACUHGC_07640 [Testudinibacter sp. P27/CKL/0425]
MDLKILADSIPKKDIKRAEARKLLEDNKEFKGLENDLLNLYDVFLSTIDHKENTFKAILKEQSISDDKIKEIMYSFLEKDKNCFDWFNHFYESALFRAIKLNELRQVAPAAKKYLDTSGDKSKPIRDRVMEYAAKRWKEDENLLKKTLLEEVKSKFQINVTDDHILRHWLKKT